MIPKHIRDTYKAQGYWMTLGVLDALGLAAMMIIAVTITLAAFRLVTGIGRDDSDPSGGFSNVSVRTDALTGCQYLQATGGALAQRVNGQGKQLGCR